jgi:hypothetical protein
MVVGSAIPTELQIQKLLIMRFSQANLYLWKGIKTLNVKEVT